MPDKYYYKIPKYPVWMECMKVWILAAVPTLLMVYASYDTNGGYSRVWYPVTALMLMPVLSTILRRTLKSLILYVLAGLIMFAWVIPAENLIMATMMVIFTGALFIYGVARSVSHEAEKDMSGFVLLTLVLVMLLIYVIMVFRGHLEYEFSLLMQGFGIAVVYLWYDHQAQVRTALKAMDKQGNMSTKRVIRFNTNVFNGYLLVGVGVFAAAYFAGLGNLVQLVGRLLLTIIRAIVGLFSKEYEIPEVESTGEGVISSGGGDEMGLPVPAQTSLFWQILQQILVVVFTGFLIACLVILLIRLFRSFHRNAVYREEGYEEYKTFYSKAKPQREKSGRLSIFDRSPENLIRRAYYKAVRKQMDKTVSRSDTPVEVGEKLPEVLQLVDSDQQVRYGGGLPDKAKKI